MFPGLLAAASSPSSTGQVLSPVWGSGGGGLAQGEWVALPAELPASTELVQGSFIPATPIDAGTPLRLLVSGRIHAGHVLLLGAPARLRTLCVLGSSPLCRWAYPAV